MADAHYRLAFVCSSDCVELTGGNLESAGVEERCDHVDASGVADEDYTVGELLGQEMEVEY